MTSEISSIASIGALSSVSKNSPQVDRTDIASLPGFDGESLPVKGKELPPSKVDSIPISEAVTRINQVVQNIQRDLSFNLDENSGRTVIRVVDSQSGELIRQIPSEEALAIASRLSDLQQESVGQGDIDQGLLFSDRT